MSWFTTFCRYYIRDLPSSHLNTLSLFYLHYYTYFLRLFRKLFFKIICCNYIKMYVLARLRINERMYALYVQNRVLCTIHLCCHVCIFVHIHTSHLNNNVKILIYWAEESSWNAFICSTSLFTAYKLEIEKKTCINNIWIFLWTLGMYNPE